jgi:hypothetical protein
MSPASRFKKARVARLMSNSAVRLRSRCYKSLNSAPPLSLSIEKLGNRDDLSFMWCFCALQTKLQFRCVMSVFLQQNASPKSFIFKAHGSLRGILCRLRKSQAILACPVPQVCVLLNLHYLTQSDNYNIKI